MPYRHSWPTIVERVASLREHAKRWHAEFPNEADFMPAFAGEADSIVDAAARISDDALDAAHLYVGEILIELGYIDPPERQTQN